MNDLQKKLDEFVKDSDLFIATPKTIESLQSKGLPIKSVHTTYEEYLDKLFEKKRQQASTLVEQLPHLDIRIANSTVAGLYEELKECFVMGINGASITMAILLLDLSSKNRLFDERQKKNPKASYKPVEDMQLGPVIRELRTHGVIDDEEEKALLSFNSEIRNNYLHYNIQKLVKDMFIARLPSVNVETGVVTIEKNVNAVDRPFLWFSAKKVLDRETILDKVNFCIYWVNKLLVHA